MADQNSQNRKLTLAVLASTLTAVWKLIETIVNTLK